uniref:Uncharacterized protein n=1 Tax=Megaviridae environmental sample TaxID=1737588 RepID=A0A5J6VJ05_9VIRU|nr:MAG: hypothetical protein [Megaviridae environmental sample]
MSIDSTALIEMRDQCIYLLQNIIAPFILEGIKSLYDKAVEWEKTKNIDEHGILEIFQTMLKCIKNWTDHNIQNETDRILELSKDKHLVENLFHASLKAGSAILNIPSNSDIYPEQSGRVFTSFIHKCYMFSGKAFHYNPILFYHELTDIEIKSNQRQAIDIIKKSIKDAILMLTPIKALTGNFLESDLTAGDDDILQLIQQNHLLMQTNQQLIAASQELHTMIKNANIFKTPQVLGGGSNKLINNNLSKNINLPRKLPDAPRKLPDNLPRKLPDNLPRKLPDNLPRKLPDPSRNSLGNSPHASRMSHNSHRTPQPFNPQYVQKQNGQNLSNLKTQENNNNVFTNSSNNQHEKKGAREISILDKDGHNIVSQYMQSNSTTKQTLPPQSIIQEMSLINEKNNASLSNSAEDLREIMMSKSMVDDVNISLDSQKKIINVTRQI